MSLDAVEPMKIENAPKSILKGSIQTLDTPKPAVKTAVLTPTMKREVERIAPIIIQKSNSNSRSTTSSSSSSVLQQNNPYASGDIQIRI